MNQQERRDFFRWLESASVTELEGTIVRLRALEVQLTEAAPRADLFWMVKKINQELRVRQEVGE